MLVEVLGPSGGTKQTPYTVMIDGSLPSLSVAAGTVSLLTTAWPGHTVDKPVSYLACLR